MGVFTTRKNDKDQEDNGKTVSFSDYYMRQIGAKDETTGDERPALKGQVEIRPRKKGEINILFVCLGNICRSAMAEAVMRKKVEEAGLEEKINVDSAGILSVHEGERADARMRQAAQRRGYYLTSISRPVKMNDFDWADYVIGMDNSNVEDLKDRAVTDKHVAKVHAMSEFFSPGCDNDYVPDPYYGGAAGFELVIDLLEDGCGNLMKEIEKKIKK